MSIARDTLPTEPSGGKEPVLSDKVGSFALVLHSHLPYVLSHGRWPHGTDWLTEATSESYVPLLDSLYRLVDAGVSPKITIGVTPILAEQLSDPAFAYEFANYLQVKVDAAEEDRDHFGIHNPELAPLADYWHERYSGIFGRFRRCYKKSVIGALKELQDAGHVEIITSGATHGYFPLLSQDTSIQAQVKQGVITYKRLFGREPKGFWLPECAYRPRYSWAYPLQPDGRTSTPYLRKGVEEFLAENGIEYFFIESHLLKGGEALGVYADRFDMLRKLWDQFDKHFLPYDGEKTEHQPYWVAGYGKVGPVAAFARDGRTGSQVWSAAHGYPGDEWYLEFHKKHHPGGHKYWRVTGGEVDLGDKQVYQPEQAAERVRSHAEHFHSMVKDVLREYKEQSGRPGLICAPFDTELFGHWWFEGTEWLFQALKLLAEDPEIELTTCADYLHANPPGEVVSLPEGSWGEGGFHWIWLNQATQWTWKLVYDAEAEIRELSCLCDGKLVSRLVKQAARELLLLQSSDWQFNISTQNSTDYAESRVKEHYRSFKRLAELARKVASGEHLDDSDADFLEVCEERVPVFPDVDPVWFSEVDHPAESGAHPERMSLQAHEPETTC